MKSLYTVFTLGIVYLKCLLFLELYSHSMLQNGHVHLGFDICETVKTVVRNINYP